MAENYSFSLKIATSSRALFDLRKENKIFEEEGVEPYSRYMREHEDDILQPGTGFPLIRAFLELNKILPEERKVEVFIMSTNSAETGLRIFNSINHYGLNITRGVFTRGVSLTRYLKAYEIDLYLSGSEKHVVEALQNKIAAGLLYPYTPPAELHAPVNQIRIAFDGDAVIFSDEAEKIYREQGFKAFIDYEKANARKPLPEGPFSKLLKTMSKLQDETSLENPPIRTALITSRSFPAHERVVRTLEVWGVRIDEIAFMGGYPKNIALKAFDPHIFFDDQRGIIEAASQGNFPAGHVVSGPFEYEASEINIGNKGSNLLSEN